MTVTAFAAAMHRPFFNGYPSMQGKLKSLSRFQTNSLTLSSKRIGTLFKITLKVRATKSLKSEISSSVMCHKSSHLQKKQNRYRQLTPRREARERAKHSTAYLPRCLSVFSSDERETQRDCEISKEMTRAYEKHFACIFPKNSFSHFLFCYFQTWMPAKVA